MDDDEKVGIDYDDILARTELALKLDVPDGPVWVMESVIVREEDETLPEVGSGSGTLMVQAWWAIKKGFA